MRALRTTALVLLLAAVAASPVLAAGADPEARYQVLLAAAKAGDQPVDWQALRFAYADRPGFDVFSDGMDPARKAMRDAFVAGDFAGVLIQAKLICDKDYVDAEAHMALALAENRLGQAALALREQDIARGLLESIETGDGKTAKTALIVIDVAEEYRLMNARGRRVTRQSLIREDGHAYDVLETVDQSGQTQKAYFLIDRVMAAEVKRLAPKP